MTPFNIFLSIVDKTQANEGKWSEYEEILTFSNRSKMSQKTKDKVDQETLQVRLSNVVT